MIILQNINILSGEGFVHASDSTEFAAHAAGIAVVIFRQTVIADKTSDNAADRVFRVRFNLKAGTYDKKKVYRLVIANEIDVEEIEFHIDIAFADDFGFDL